jgi:ribulose kinase
VLVVLFAASGGLVIESVAAQVGLDASRADLVHAYVEQTDVPGGARLAAVAAQTHRLERGIRLM